MKNDPYVVATFLKSKERDNWPADGTSPIVTIARQHGSGGSEMAVRTAELLTAQNPAHPWIVLDKDVAERVIDDHHLPKRIARFLSEEENASIDGHLDGILGLSVPYATAIRNMAQTMVRIAKLGHVILVGRAAHVITAGFPRAVHVRVVGSFDHRVEWIMATEHCSLDEAADRIREADEHRRHFAAKHFKIDLSDPTQYDMTINSDRVTMDEGAHLIAQMISSPHFREREANHLVELRQMVLG